MTHVWVLRLIGDQMKFPAGSGPRSHAVRDGDDRALCGASASARHEWREAGSNVVTCPRCEAALTHSIPYDSPKTRGLQVALCGVTVRSTQYSSKPTCPSCARIVEEQNRLESPFGDDSAAGASNVTPKE